MEKLYLVFVSYENGGNSNSIIRASQLKSHIESALEDIPFETPDSWDIFSDVQTIGSTDPSISSYVEITPIDNEEVSMLRDVVLHSDSDQIYLAWCTADVTERARQNEQYINTEYARRVLADADHNHDANYGIGWETLDVYIDMHIPDMLKEWNTTSIATPENINSIDDIAHFFANLTLFHKIAHHPDTPFADYINAETKEPTFSAEGAKNMDAIMDRCHEVFDIENANLNSEYEDIYEVAIRVDNIIQNNKIADTEE